VKDWTLTLRSPAIPDLSTRRTQLSHHRLTAGSVIECDGFEAPLETVGHLSISGGKLGSKWGLDPENLRFWSKVDASGPCWEWTAAIGKTGGYGKYSYRLDGKVKYVYAHRYAYHVLVGPVPDGLELDHLCRNRKCVNPDHLDPVTRRENVRRGVGPTGRNMGKTHCPFGHEYTKENTYKLKSGVRQCKMCGRARDKVRFAEKAGR